MTINPPPVLTITIEYDRYSKRAVKSFEDFYKAKAFFVRKHIGNRNPQILGKRLYS